MSFLIYPHFYVDFLSNKTKSIKTKTDKKSDKITKFLTNFQNDAILLDKKVGGGYNKLTSIAKYTYYHFLAYFGQKCPKMWITA